MQYKIRAADSGDLEPINATVRDAVSSWQLTKRTLRLSLPALEYKAEDFTGMQFRVADSSRDGIVAVICWERPEAPCFSIHGLYVGSAFGGHGIGSALLTLAESVATNADASTIILKAWRRAESFFRRRGYTDAEGGSATTGPSYPVPLTKSLQQPSAN